MSATKEAWGELLVPCLKPIPVFHTNKYCIYLGTLPTAGLEAPCSKAKHRWFAKK